VLCSNFSETINAFADFFAFVYSSDSTLLLPNISSFKYKNLLTDISITKEMVRQQINNLSENVAPGPDKLIFKVLKTNCDQILEPLTKIVQTSFLTGRLPKLWQQAIVTPIFKKADKLDVSNYRPIA
jgi:hypothetical protein